MDCGGTATGKTPKSALQPAFGQPECRFRFFPGRNSAKIQPGRPISGPESLLRNIEEVNHKKCIWFGAIDVTKLWFGAIDDTKPYEFIRFGAIDDTKPYKIHMVWDHR